TMRGKPDTIEASADRPLSALLSQTLVAFTIELDNEFERRMVEAGYAGAGLSLVLWLTVMRFLLEEGVTVGELMTRTSSSPERMKHALGCLERWRFVTFEPDSLGGPTVVTKLHRRSRRMVRD